jgi:hypothetical protein
VVESNVFRYERATLPEKVSDWQFRQRSVTNVYVWLRRIIGYLLDGLVSVYAFGVKPTRLIMFAPHDI